MDRMSRASTPRFVTLAVASAWLLSGCGIISFDVSQDIPAQTIQGSPLGDLLPSSLFSIPINIDLSSATSAHGTGPARSANLKSLTLTITSPSDGTFDFVSSIAISISSSAGGLPDQQIAKLEPVPGTQTISIPPTPGVDLLPYIKAGATITATASGHLPAQNVTFDGKVVVTVHV